ncbi:MAG TPA: carboxypeptidase regulatory-like domain-containing protein [Bacteroidota bacterium]|jgi:hypothetical protein
MQRSIVLLCVILLAAGTLRSQGVTTASMSGIVTTDQGEPLPGANVVAVHEPTGTRFGTSTRINGQFDIPNMKIGGPYTLTVTHIGYKSDSKKDLYLSLAQSLRSDFQLVEEAVQGREVVVTADTDAVLNSGRTGAATFITPSQVQELPSVKRSTRDLTRVDPRSDGNFSFGGKNWLYNNISLDGSYFNNPYGLDDPAPGGQTGAEPVPFDAVEQVQVSVAPFDVREGGFTGAGINTVTKSGTNEIMGSMYNFYRNADLVGNSVRGNKVLANPTLAFHQSGFTLSGPIVPNTLFFFMNGEVVRREDPASDFAANHGQSGFGISRVRASTMDSIRQRMLDVYGYDPGPYEGYNHSTDNDKFLAKLDWNLNEDNNVTLRFDYLNGRRELGPHPFVLSYANTGRGPNENSLPFRNSGYRINNHLNSFALETNSRFGTMANRFFASYNRFRDFRDPFSRPFPTIEIGQDGVTYTTLGHEPFSIDNTLDQDVWQFTDNFTYSAGQHVLTLGGNFEKFSFFNSFNLFRYGVFFLPPSIGGSTFDSPAEFFQYTDPSDTSKFLNWNAQTAAADKSPFKGEDISAGQLSFYGQDEFLATRELSLTYGLRVDIPIYFTTPVDNPFSRSLLSLDGDGNPETIDQSKLPSAKPLFSPRVGFNWNASGDRTTQVRGGTGIFTGRIPFVWFGNNISNPGFNPNLPPWEQTFYVNAMATDFKWPQAWTNNIAVDHMLPGDLLGTLEFLYSKDINAVYLRNGNLGAPIGKVSVDGRPYYPSAQLNPSIGGLFVIDNTSEGYNWNVTGQLRKTFDFGLHTSLSYTYLEAKNQMKSTEIASVLWSGNPVQGNPNKPELSFSEFGERQRIIGTATLRHVWSEHLATSFGVFFEVAEGNTFAGAGGNRYSFTYSGDVNNDGSGGNDLMYIPRDQSEITFAPYTDKNGNTVTAAQQWASFDAFIRQDDYLNSHRGQIAERFGALNPWFSNVDFRVLQDITFMFSGQPHTFELSADILNAGNLLSSSWGVRSAASAAATTPLVLARVDNPSPGVYNPVFNYKALAPTTFTDDPGLNSRWQIQLGLRYMFNH